MPAIIEFTEITKVYATGYQEVVALSGISLTLRRGEFVAVMGPSGSGKSTLMNIAGCLDKPSGGIYKLDGRDVTGLKEIELAKVRNKNIGFVFQAFNLLPKLTALRNVEVPLIYKGVPKEERLLICERMLSEVGLKDRMFHKPSELSGGQQQRVAIARAMASAPDIILADEPTGNLDSKSGHEIMNLFISLVTRGMTIVIVTHDSKIADLTARNIHMLDGKIVRDEYL